jgi:diguanylate cyclase (GGDEF)-like protein
MSRNGLIVELVKKIEEVLFSDHESAKIMTQELLELSTEEKNAFGLFKANNFLGVICSERGLVDEALNYYSVAMSYTIFDALEKEKPVLLNNIGTTLADRSNYFEAIENFTEALAIIYEKGFRKDLIFTLNLNIAASYLQINEPDEALKLIDEAMKYFDEQSVEDLTEMLGLLADAYLKKGDSEKAYSNILRCEEEAQKSNFATMTGLVEYYKAKYFELTEDFEAAETFYWKVLSVQLQNEPFYYFNKVAKDYIHFKINRKQYTKAIKFIHRAIEIAERKNWTWVISDYYRYLSECYKQTENWPDAIEIMSRYFALDLEQKKNQYGHLYQCFKVQEKVLKMNLANKSLYDSVDRLKTFNHIISQINRSEDLTTLIYDQLSELKSLFKIDTFALGIYNSAERRIEYVLKYENGERAPTSYVDYDNLRSFSNWVRMNDQPIIIDDIDDLEYIKAHYPNVKTSKDDIINTGNYSKSMVIWPMRVEGKSIGLINCQAIAENTFSTFDLELIEMLASHLAIAQENHRQKKELNEAVERLNKLSYIDGLTGIYNRQALNEYMPELYSKAIAEESNIAFAMLDLDNFKQLNDQYGHQEGDHCLSAFAALLVDTIGNLGHIYRYGGDEFSMVFIGVELAVVENVLKEVISKSKAFYMLGGLVPITASIGAIFMERGKEKTLSLTTFINYADNALYIAKSEGKCNFKKVVL